MKKAKWHRDNERKLKAEFEQRQKKRPERLKAVQAKDQEKKADRQKDGGQVNVTVALVVDSEKPDDRQGT